MVTMQKRASGLQVRRHSFVNFNYNTPFRVMHFRSGEAGDRLTARLRKNLVPDVRLKNILPDSTKLNINNEAQNKTFRL